MPRTPNFDDTLVLVTEEGLGRAEPELMRTVFLKYLDVLDANGTLPGAMAFTTRGV